MNGNAERSASLRRAAQHCRACRHEKRDEIDCALVGGEASRTIALRYGLSPAGVRRHQSAHLAPMLRQAHVEEETARVSASQDVVSSCDAREATRVSTIRDIAWEALAKHRAIIEKAEQEGNLRMVLIALRQQTPLLELLARIFGELDPVRNETNILNVTVSEETAQKIAETYLARRQPAQIAERRQGAAIDAEVTHI